MSQNPAPPPGCSRGIMLLPPLTSFCYPLRAELLPISCVGLEVRTYLAGLLTSRHSAQGQAASMFVDLIRI